MFIIITGAMTFKIMVKVYAGHYFCFGIALGKYDAQVLPVGRKPFYCIYRAGFTAGFTFTVIDLAVLQNKFHFFLGYLAAVHPAAGMLGIFQESYPPVEPIVTVDIAGSGGGGRLTGTCVIAALHYQRKQHQHC
jgi:hypothetical protein